MTDPVTSLDPAWVGGSGVERELESCWVMGLRTARALYSILRRTVMVVWPVAIGLGCGEGVIEPPVPVPASIVLVSGDGQKGEVAEPLGAPLVVRVTDQFGNPFDGLMVTWTVSPDAGSVSPDTGMTDADGAVATNWTLGTASGAHEVTVVAEGLEARITFSATAEPGAVVAMIPIGGNAQVQHHGTELADPVTVELRDQYDNPVPGLDVEFVATMGSGTVSGAVARTGTDGRAATRWTLGPQGGDHALEARHGSLAPLILTAKALTFEVILLGPFAQQRYVAGEEVAFSAEVNGDAVANDDIEWLSDIAGEIGRGIDVAASDLPVGTHEIVLSVLGVTRTVSIRIFADLWDLYRSEPAPAEIERILNDFTIEYIDGDEPHEQWDQYGFDFNPEEDAPSRLVVVAKLDLLRRQRFDERPLFIGNHASVYDWVRSLVHTISVDLGTCGGGSGGGGRVNLNGGHAYWGILFSNTCELAEDIDFDYYHGMLGLLVHEARHSEPDDPRHVVCANGLPGDTTLEDGSGYAWSAQYLMWVYQYSQFDPVLLRAKSRDDSFAPIPAGERAKGLLDSRICGTPSHSDSRIQAIIDDLLGG